MDKRQQSSSGVQRTAGNGQRINFISKGKHSAALWALKLYDLLGFKRNIHIRRLHYHALLQDGLTLPSGKAYRNTLADCDYLERAFDQARLMGFVPYDVFSDACRFFEYALCRSDIARRQLLKQKIEQACKRHMRNMLARIAPVHVEIWLEQTTAADIVTPLAEKYRLGIVTNQNDISLTSIWHFLRRIANISKPVRILYISDFAPRILSAAPDRIAAVMSQYGLSRSVDLKIKKLAMSCHECEKYDLPCAPGPASIKSNSTELHALEAAAPEYLCKTLEKHINQYFDCSLFTNAAKQTEESINRLMVKINRTIDEKTGIYEFLHEIQSNVFSN